MFDLSTGIKTHSSPATSGLHETKTLHPAKLNPHDNLTSPHPSSPPFLPLSLPGAAHALNSPPKLRRNPLPALNLLNNTRRPIRTRLREPTQVRRIKPQTNNRVAPPLLTLAHDPAQRVVAAVIQHRREPPQLSARKGLDGHAQARGDVARAHREAVDCA
ncbi:hypothetical protein Landi51_07054 [Colletotrichum acutatum]